MEKEISITYRFNPNDFDEKGRRYDDGTTFRDVVKDFERDFHSRYSSEYAMNLYTNRQTMIILAKSCDAAPFMEYGMDLTKGRSFDAVDDPFVNHIMDIHSKHIYVYGIDSVFMTEFEENGYPKLDEESDIYPLTLLIDDTMQDGTLRLATITTDDGDDTVDIIIDVPIFDFA